MIVGLMGLGGAVIAGFTQGAKQDTEHQRYLHNQRVLQEAKQALLQYAYNYPQLGPGQNDGPGRLPCPDTDNDGDEDYVASCNGDMVGRFPWKVAGLDFYDARDASGEPLWYAVSNNFGRGGSSAINSDTTGGITVEDRSGATIHDAGAGSGVVAVIIAPGPPIARNGAMQVRGTADEKKDEENYLDLFGAVDNADFVDDDADNGFVTGPIRDVITGDLLVNDQMIVVTAAEVHAMAEIATLQAYRSAILDYLAQTGGVYPWLYNYEGIDYDLVGGETNDIAVAKLDSYYPVDADWGSGTNYHDDNGRIPSIFAEYFTEVDSQAIETSLSGSMTLIDPGAPDTFTLTQLVCDKSCATGGARTFQRDSDPDVEGPTLDIEFTQPLTDVGFVDIPDIVGADGRIKATFTAPESVPFDLYFWGEHDDQSTVWTACPDGANELSDCEFSSGGNRSILHLQGKIDFSAGETFFDFDYNSPPTIVREPATGASHAWIEGTYSADAIVSFPGVFSAVTYEYDGHWHEDDVAIKDGDHSNEDYSTGTVDMTGFSLASLTLGLRYYPEIPAWALDNDWHKYIKMAYAPEYRPGATGPCSVGSTCLYLEDSPGAPWDKISLLLMGHGDWVDNDEVLPGSDSVEDGELKDELRDVFEEGNHNGNASYYIRRGNNDRLLVIDEL